MMDTAAQPHPSLVRQENSHDAPGTRPTNPPPFSSQLPPTHNNLTPPQTSTTTLEESPTQPPSTTGTTNTTISLNQQHRDCIIEMDANRDRVLAATIGHPFEVMAAVVHNIIYVLTHGIVSLFVGIAAALSAIDPGLLVLFLFAWFLLWVPYRHYVLASRRVDPKELFPRQQDPSTPHYVLIVCGSGGHTSEMIKMIQRSIRFEGLVTHRRWVIGYGDKLSFDKVISFERRLNQLFTVRGVNIGTFDIMFFRRPRAVHQSWFTTPYTTFLSAFDVVDCLTATPRRRNSSEFELPGVIVSNGPGTAFLFLLVAHVMKMLHIADPNTLQTVFIESWARVKTLSFSGKLVDLFGVADVFVVQHRPLAQKYPHLVFVRNLVRLPIIPTIEDE